MTLVQVLLLAVGAVVSFLVGDMLDSRELPRWPHTVALLVLAVVGGYARSEVLIALMLGAGLGWIVIGGVQVYRSRREVAGRQGRRRLTPRQAARQAEIQQRHVDEQVARDRSAQVNRAFKHLH